VLEHVVRLIVRVRGWRSRRGKAAVLTSSTGWRWTRRGVAIFLETEVAKVRVGGKRGLLVLPRVLGHCLVDALHGLQ